MSAHPGSLLLTLPRVLGEIGGMKTVRKAMTGTCNLVTVPLSQGASPGSYFKWHAYLSSASSLLRI